jgi:hypothetical protein
MWFTPLVFLLASLAWTWPAAVTDGVLGRNPDGLGTAWFIGSVPRWIFGLHDPDTGFPAGADYGRPDSFLLAAMALIFQWAPAARVLAWVHVLGVALSAWAAERFARELGARPPWSLLAGFSFAFCGLASTALLEGYAYHVFNPWMPLLAAAWWRATSAKGTWQDGAASGVWFVLTVLTTAWLGAAASFLVVGFLGEALLSRRRRLNFWALAAASNGIQGLNTW